MFMFAATASTDKRIARDTVHNDSLFCSTMSQIISNQYQYHSSAQIISLQIVQNNLRTAGAVILQLAQLPCP